MVYGLATPSTPPRNRTSRSTSVSAGSSWSTVNGAAYRSSPRKRGRRGVESMQPTVASADERDSKRRIRRVHDLRRAVLARWRALVVVLLVAVALVYWLVREPERPLLIIPNRPYSTQTYRHLDFSKSIALRPATRVLHVTKEFGPATMGGLGVMLTALSIAQSESPYLSISVALPHYSYLRDRFINGEIQPFANLSIPFTSNPSSSSRARTTHIRVPVSLLRWTYSSAPDFLDPNSPLTTNSADSYLTRTIDIYLVGPSSSKPFSAAFRAKDEGDIYSAYKPLKQEWKDLYFARAAVELVGYLGAKDETTVFEDELGVLDDEEEEERLEKSKLSARRRVDVVHLHGATNAMVAHFLREREREHQRDEPHSRHPAIVYTLHDSLDEVEYSNLVKNVVHFLPPPSPSSSAGALSSPTDSLARLSPYIYRAGTQLFTSALGIDLADAVTFVSRSIAADIVSGRFRFHLEGLVMPSIAKRAQAGAFIGVSNGLDFTEKSKNPFTSPLLLEHGLAFPRIGADVLAEDSYVAADGSILSFAETKQRAKAYLVSHLPAVFTHPQDADRPWFLFIGRYQYNKGCQFFSTLLEILTAPGASGGRLILLGARNNYPFSALQSLARQYPQHLTLVDDVATPGFQAQWSPLLRMASDVAVVPSLSEAFGLVAAEGLLFGMPVLTTGVGGLREFLVPLSASGGQDDRGNAYLFDLFPPSSAVDKPDTQGAEADYSRSAQDVRPSDEQLEPARAALRLQTRRAIRDWEMWRDGSWESRERFARRMVAGALELKWNREKGPVEEYVRVYDLALTTRRRRLGLPRYIPPPPSSAHEDDEPAPPSRPIRPAPHAFHASRLRQHLLEHPVAVPHIEQGGHDRVSGSDGLANLLVDREEVLRRELARRDRADSGADEGEAVEVQEEERPAREVGRKGAMLPIVKIWGADAEEKARAALAKEAMARKVKRKKQAAGAAKKKTSGKKDGRQEALKKTLEKVARSRKRGGR
ncbi:hypothetical protein JCM8097_001980 [Rhodosporidiobolus ruineniae]